MKKIFGIFIGVFTLLFFSSIVSAEEITVSVSGNGADSDNDVNLSVETTTTITQTNTADISNNIEENLNTGNNQANNNSGDNTEITTGNLASQTEISNNTNNNLASVNDCGCNLPINIENSDNGTNSENLIKSEIKNASNISAENHAVISNQVNVYANTGKNESNNNVGNVNIATGNVEVRGKVKNQANSTVIEVDPSNTNGVSIVNSFNGANSQNVINVQIENILNISKFDFAIVENYVDIITDTGNNSAYGNVGDVLISTGDIAIDFEIINDPINSNFVVIGGPKIQPPIGEDIPQAEVTPAAPAPAAAAPAAEVLAAAAAAAAGQVLAAAQEVLPVTGPTHFLLLITIWVSLFLLGLLLRRISGLSPPNHNFLVV